MSRKGRRWEKQKKERASRTGLQAKPRRVIGWRDSAGFSNFGWIMYLKSRISEARLTSDF